MMGAFLFRLVFAAFCGTLIGMERRNRLKEAGVRTHLIVSVGACLATLVSKYGFFDLAQNSFIKLDPSRVTASIVCGIGFLGAGMIAVRGYTVTGLTTAAGIWTMASIGMAIGCGMYLVGGFTTVLILTAQTLLHLTPRDPLFPEGKMLLVKLCNDRHTMETIIQKLKALDVGVLNLELTGIQDGQMQLELFLRLPKGISGIMVAQEISQIHGVSSLEF